MTNPYTTNTTNPQETIAMNNPYNTSSYNRFSSSDGRIENATMLEVFIFFAIFGFMFSFLCFVASIFVYFRRIAMKEQDIKEEEIDIRKYAERTNTDLVESARIYYRQRQKLAEICAASRGIKFNMANNNSNVKNGESIDSFIDKAVDEAFDDEYNNKDKSSNYITTK